MMKTPWGEAPSDWEHPDWESTEKCHDWKNHISDRVRELWRSFTCEQMVALANQANDLADQEEWDSKTG